MARNWNNYCPVSADEARHNAGEDDPADYAYTVRSRCACGRFFRREMSAYSPAYDGPARCPACLGLAYSRNGAK
jgi:hypothetical protein